MCKAKEGEGDRRLRMGRSSGPPAIPKGKTSIIDVTLTATETSGDDMDSICMQNRKVGDDPDRRRTLTSRCVAQGDGDSEIGQGNGSKI